MLRSILLLNKGKVVKWIPHRGFGFIVEEGTNISYFVHHQALKVPEGTFRALRVGQRVEFTVAKDGDRGDKAVDVTATGGGLLPETPRRESPRPRHHQFDDRAPHQQVGRGGQRKQNQEDHIKHDGPSTCPTDGSGADTETRFRRGNEVHTNVVENFDDVEQSNNKSTLVRNMPAMISTKPPLPMHVDVEKYLTTHLKDTFFKCSAVVEERGEPRSNLGYLLQDNSFVCCTSPRGSGKTQFVKHFLFTWYHEDIKYGRVIVRCCDMAQKSKAKWIELVMGFHAGRSCDAEDGLCELIRSHVESVTGRYQPKSNYNKRKDAYETWMRETALHFGIRYDMKKMDPLIVLDSCEVFGHTEIDTPYTLLETLCCRIAGPHKMFAIGCGGPTGDLSSYRTIMKLEPLLPLSESAHKDAATTWGKTVDAILYGPIHRWAAGLPRLLVAAHAQCTGTVNLANADTVATFFQRFQAAAATSYCKIRPEWFPQAFSCLLISSTKLKVYHDGNIPINPKWRSLLRADGIIAINRHSKTSLENDWGHGGTFRQAASRSIGWYRHIEEIYTYNKKRFVVPPIIFTDEVMNDLMLENGIQDPPIMPSQLHPPLTDEIAWRLGKCSNSERGRLFNKSFVYAVYARYLLAHWQNPDSEWVRLTDVFECAFQERQKYDISNYEVNLSGGVHVKDSGLLYADAVPNALTYFGSPAHHDAYMFCRTVENGVVTWEGAVPLQMRHDPKPRDLADKMWTTGKPPKELSTKKGKSGASTGGPPTETTPTPPREAVRLLFCVNQSECKVLSQKRIVMIAADRMSSVSSLWPHSKEGNVKCIVGTKENIINVGEAF